MTSKEREHFVIIGDQPKELVTVKSPTDRREHKRFKVNFSTTVKTESHFFTQETEDLSVGGLFLACKEQLPIGKCLQLSIQLPDHSKEIVVAGEVRWVRHSSMSPLAAPSGLGVVFCDLDDSARTAIEDYLAWRETTLVYD